MPCFVSAAVYSGGQSGLDQRHYFLVLKLQNNTLRIREEWLPLVKGISRRVIVVDSPDPKLFEQAIFIVKNDAFSQEGVTSQQVLGEACRIARSCAAQTVQPPLWRRIPLWGWAAGLAAIAAALMAWLL